MMIATLVYPAQKSCLHADWRVCLDLRSVDLSGFEFPFQTFRKPYPGEGRCGGRALARNVNRLLNTLEPRRRQLLS
jgi:hypothetical protein